MRRIILGLITIIGAAAVITSGATGAFFSDTETSSANTFQAGAIDLKIDNDSYYNGNRCAVDVNDIDGDQNISEYVWQGSAIYPVPGTDCSTSFPEGDLDSGLVFFNFNDLKPDDEGEDTISIHVQNDAWACMDLTLVSNDDKSSNEPELEVDVQDDQNDVWDGELAQNLQFFWWADDGDNVYEVGEQALSNGVETLTGLATSTGSFRVTLADSQSNAWGLPVGTPLPGGDTVFMGKAWCFGTLTPDPVEAGAGVNPSVDPGVDCDGTSLGNETQTDGAEINVMFTAVQARNNTDFLCNPRQPQTVTLTVNKILTVSSQTISVEDFTLHIAGPVDQDVLDEIPVTSLPSGNYTVSESITGDVGGATFNAAVFGGACNSSGQVTLNPGDNKVCTILNVQSGIGL